METNGVAAFRRTQAGVTTIIRENLALFAIGVHCVAHCTNLCVQMLFAVPLVHNV